jgi:hypothetical protein
MKNQLSQNLLRNRLYLRTLLIALILSGLVGFTKYVGGTNKYGVGVDLDSQTSQLLDNIPGGAYSIVFPKALILGILNNSNELLGNDRFSEIEVRGFAENKPFTLSISGDPLSEHFFFKLKTFPTYQDKEITDHEILDFLKKVSFINEMQVKVSKFIRNNDSHLFPEDSIPLKVNTFLYLATEDKDMGSIDQKPIVRKESQVYTSYQLGVQTRDEFIEDEGGIKKALGILFGE